MARGAADFASFAPVLEEWVGLVREVSSLIDPSRPPYDVALEEFEKGMTAARLDEVFSQARVERHRVVGKTRTWRGTLPLGSGCVRGLLLAGSCRPCCCACATLTGAGRCNTSVTCAGNKLLKPEDDGRRHCDMCSSSHAAVVGEK